VAPKMELHKPCVMAKMLLPEPFDLQPLPGLESEIERPPRLLPSVMARMQLPWQCVLESSLKQPDLLSCAMDPVKVKAVAQKFKITNFNVNDFEDPTKVTNASVDEIGVTAQNPKRPMPKGMTKKAYTETTVIHVQNEIGNYILSGDGIANTLKSMRGYLALNNLLYDPIVFFSDGARSIHNEIESMFSFTSYKVILDWFHLKKKFQEFFSMAFKGKDIRNAQLNIVMPMLWYGNVAAAIAFMEKADDSIVKSRTRLDELIGYLNRNRPNIPNYALRKKLRLRNSSNLGEKANDLVIARRQKNHGASFSDHGSLGLGAVCCTCLNNELESWVKTNTISFTPIPKLAKAA
jgi:hypothetical protein